MQTRNAAIPMVQGDETAVSMSEKDEGERARSLKSKGQEEETQQDAECRYKNNLLWQVGFLELTNALDFPANVWNQIPTPLFAAVLMGIGGSIAILWSIFPFLDMRKSLDNVRLLRRERRFLKSWQLEFEDEDTVETRALVQAWIDVNLREILWELVDRVLLDICAGISGILVGTGALMAIRGDIDIVFTASNLLSGYVGNSFLAPFALLNTIWAIFMWMRAEGERITITRVSPLVDVNLQIKMKQHGRKHKFYALLNGVTAIAGCVGSILSSTLWYGYIVIAPCVFSSVYCNWFWRHSMGYNRGITLQKDTLRDMDISRIVHVVTSTILSVDAGLLDDLPCFVPNEKRSERISRYMSDLGLTTVIEQEITQSTYQSTVDRDTTVMQQAKSTIIAERRTTLLCRERFFLELYGRYLRAVQYDAG